MRSREVGGVAVVRAVVSLESRRESRRVRFVAVMWESMVAGCAVLSCCLSGGGEMDAEFKDETDGVAVA